MSRAAGVVLCGGAGRRMGADKALLDAAGSPLVLRVADALGTVAAPVLLARGELPPIESPYQNLRDARPRAGPLAGIVAGLRATDAELLAVVATDMPYASPAVLSLLIDLWRGEDAVVPEDEEGSQPLHAVYARSALVPLERALAENVLSMRKVLERISVRTVEPPEWRAADPTGRFGTNINTPDGLLDLP